MCNSKNKDCRKKNSLILESAYTVLCYTTFERCFISTLPSFSTRLGFTEIKELDEYVGLKCLYLECNAISEISGLENQTELRCLLLHNNVIKKIENLEHCLHLDSINLSHNFITTIENLGSDILPKLNTLTIRNNSLRTEESIANLVQCKTLSVLDLSHNRIVDIVIVKVLGQMPELRVLVLTGNPVINQIPAYRKTLILNCKNLTYLDTRPVFDVDRACAEAWKRGGYEEERKERMRWNQEERRRLISSFHSTIAIEGNVSANSENIFIAADATDASDHASDSDDSCTKEFKDTPDEQGFTNIPSKMPETFLEEPNPMSNYDEQGSAPAPNDISNNDDLCSNEFQHTPETGEDELPNVLSKNSNESDDFNNSDEFQDVECEESDDSDVSFLSSLEQFVGNDDSVNLQNVIVSCENTEPNGENTNCLVIIEEIQTEANIVDVKGLTASSDNVNDSKSSEVCAGKAIENSKGNGTDVRGNSMKITFYCESVNKLMSDNDGGECDELIQEITQTVDNLDSSI